MATNDFESFFGEFVVASGGELIPKGEAESADYLFRTDDVIAELKTLEEQAVADYMKKLGEAVVDWQRRGLIRIYGRARIDLQKITSPIIQREWMDILKVPIERIVRKANSQIRESKAALQMPTAQGLLLVANRGNVLHASPTNFLTVVAHVLKKKTPEGENRFPHIQGVSYLSAGVGSSEDSGLPFWYAGALENRSPIEDFQSKLRESWCNFYAKRMGVTVEKVEK